MGHVEDGATGEMGGRQDRTMGRMGPQGGQEGGLSARPGAAAPAPHLAPVHVSSGQQDTCLSKAPLMGEPGTLHTSLYVSDVHGAALLGHGPPCHSGCLWLPTTQWSMVRRQPHVTNTACPRASAGGGGRHLHLLAGSLEDQPHTNAMGTGCQVWPEVTGETHETEEVTSCAHSQSPAWGAPGPGDQPHGQGDSRSDVHTHTHRR